MIRTAGTLSLLTRAWNLHADIGDPALKRLGVLASDHFWMTISFILPDQLDAAIQACGGSVVDVARFIVQGLEAKLGMLPLFHDKQPAFTLAPFLLLMDSMLHTPGSDFLDSLVNHGILGVLTDVLSILKGDFMAQFHPIVVIALEVIILSIDRPGQISIARTNGLMRVILTLGQRDRDPLVQEKISLIISTIAPQCLVHQRALNTLHDIREGLANFFPVNKSL
ncbi:hypothetical protein GGX14DRAFT_561828 [Mycena pura]|uniref:Uncharacterized protein n=1 Tax=Mycena pura TaxID=153505 RepID=A0AAD6YHD4_9AGAR|nr:hypothetical protein GGX14DRAFT_561828 [Mycena pura]